jgi:hypothetical protein
MKTYSIKISEAVCCAMSLDDPAMQKQYALTWKMLRHGMRATGTAEQLEQLAYHMTRESGWDLAPQTIAACNRQSKAIRELLAKGEVEHRVAAFTCRDNSNKPGEGHDPRCPYYRKDVTP